jgi:F420-dependent oxidoreductase-like protein
MRAPITLGLHLPNFNHPGVEPDGLFDKLVDIATTAESSGFSSITVMDHLHQIRGVGPETNWMFEGNTMLGALAARTSKVSVGLLVAGVMYRNPALLAKITTGLDIISGGRAILGLGAAWFEGEHLAYGYDFPPLRERFEHLEDALRISRAMFTSSPASYEGKHHSISGALNNPQPLRGDIPIMVGGSGEKKTLRLVAKYADACNVFADVAQAKHLMGVLDGHCADVGRDPREITRTKLASIVIAPTHDEAMAKLDVLKQAGMPPERLASMVMAGDPGEVAEQVSRFMEVGIEGLVVSIPDVHDLEVVELVGRSLGPVLGAAAV